MIDGESRSHTATLYIKKHMETLLEELLKYESVVQLQILPYLLRQSCCYQFLCYFSVTTSTPPASVSTR